MNRRIAHLSLLLFCLIVLAGWYFLRIRALGRVISAAPASPYKSSALAAPDSAMRAKVSEAYGRLPLSFEANAGQMDARVKFFSRGAGYGLFLMANEAVLELRNEDSHPQSATVRMKLVKANPSPKIEGLDQLPGKSNYLIGADPKRWRKGVANYAKVRYREVYPGVDLIFYGNQNRLEYDFVVAPGADPKAIRMAFEGARRMSVDESGELVLTVTGGEIRQRAPVVYQEAHGRRRIIAGRYALLGKDRIGFRVAAYDRSRPLVIDPVLSFSSFFGGSRGDFVGGIAVDADGNLYLTGSATSADLATGSLSQRPASPDVLFKSVNGADNWSGANSPLAGVSINALAVAPGNPSTIYAATGKGVYKSADGGGA